MKSYRKSLPPLDTLVFYEAAYRHLNFSDAAAELFVSQAAVSKRIQQLETWLGVELFDRSGRKLLPTEAGRALADKTAVSLDFLHQAIQSVKAPAQPAVKVASMTALATFWLQPRLKAYALSEVASQLNLITTDNRTELLDPANDLAIVYGDGRFPGWNCAALFPEKLLPVGTPDVVKAIQSGMATQDIPLLDYPRMGPDWISWETWSRYAVSPAYPPIVRVQCASYTQAIGRALKGQGIALGSLTILEDELHAGTLVPLDQEPLETGLGYFMVWPEIRGLSENAERLKDLLVPEPIETSGGNLNAR
jgi:LysR family glycine cleavage system transcriptional activator